MKASRWEQRGYFWVVIDWLAIPLRHKRQIGRPMARRGQRGSRCPVHRELAAQGECAGGAGGHIDYSFHIRRGLGRVNGLAWRRAGRAGEVSEATWPGGASSLGNWIGAG